MKSRTKKTSFGLTAGLVALALSSTPASAQNPYRIATVAGTAYDRSGNNGPAINASIQGLGAAFRDGYLYLADSFRIWRVDPSGTITTVVGLLSSTYPYTPVAGYAGDGGPGIGAGLRGADGLEFDSAGNFYISDGGDGCVRKVTARVVNGMPQPLNGTEVVTTFVGTCTQTSSILNTPVGLAFDSGAGVRDQALYIADPGNANVRKVDMVTSAITTVPGAFVTPAGVAVDPATGALYIADEGGGATHAPGQVFRVDPSGTVTSIAAAPAVTTPSRVKFGNGGILYALDTGAGKVWQIANAGLTTQTINAAAGLTFQAGQTGQDIALDGAGGLFVTDVAKGKVYFAAGQTEMGSVLGQSFSPASVIVVAGPSSVPTFAGDGGPATQARMFSPNNMTLDPNGNLYISDNGNSRIRMVNAATGTISTIAGNGVAGFSGVPGPAASASISPAAILYQSGSGLFFNNASTRVINDSNGDLSVVNGTSGIPNASSIAFDVVGNLYVGDTVTGALWKVDPSGSATKIATGVSPSKGIGVDPYGNLYIAKASTHQIQKVTPNGVVSIYAGNGVAGGAGDGGPATQAQLQAPGGFVCDSVGNLYFTDGSNHTVRKIDTAGIITTIGGTPGVGGYSGDGGPAVGSQLEGGNLAFDAWGNLYLSDIFNQVIRVLDNTLPVVTTVATTGGTTPYFANTWTNQTVTVQFTCSDTGSGVATCPGIQTFGSDGVYTATGTATDRAGNSGTGTFAGIEVDKTAPTIAATATNADGTAYAAGAWTNQTATVHFTCADNLSGVATCPGVQTFGSDGVYSATGTATDQAGNSATAVFGIQVDKTPPNITYSGNAGVYTVGQTVSITCTASDTGSGIATSTCANISGAGSSFGPGPHTVTSTAIDKAGNTATASTTFTVVSGAAPASASDCNGYYNGTFSGDIHVSNGQTCAFISGGITGNMQGSGNLILIGGARVNGDTTITGGQLTLGAGASIGGNLTVSGAASFQIGPSVAIGNNLTIQSQTAGLPSSQICGTAIKGNLTVQSDGSGIEIGSSGPSCPGNSVGGNLQVQQNSGSISVYGNSVKGNLQCQNNSLIQGTGNIAAQKQGQCAAF